MTETFLFTIADKVLGNLGSLALQEVCLAWGVASERDKLWNTLSTIRAVLLDAEQQPKNHQLNDWLGKLRDALYDVDDVLDEFHYEALRGQVVNRGGIKSKVRNFLSHSNPLAFHFKMGHKIKNIREKLDEIASEKDKFHLMTGVEDRRVMHKERELTHSFVRASDVIGRDEDKEKIVQLLMCPDDGENVSIIPIVGIGGLGKTTLAKLVYNDERIVSHFELKMWVCVSKDFNVTKLTKEIYKSAFIKIVDESAIGQFFDVLPIDKLQNNLRINLDNKKFLLILDDIWNDDRSKWMELRDFLLGGANGSKIVVTTRSQSVASIMRTTIPEYNLKGLSNEDCLSLFVKSAFNEGEEEQHPNLSKIGEDIVKKCGGVPLAVRTLGSLLYSKRDVRDWMRVNDNEIWKLEQREGDILPALRLSYNQMPSYLKQCFVFCSIFPKDFKFLKDDLIHLWITQGLLQSSNGDLELEDIAEQSISKLKSLSFIQDAEDFGPFLKFRMHDVVRDLALSMAQTECCTMNSDNILRNDISPRVRHMSFSGKDLSLDDVQNFLLSRNNLRTILFPVGGVGPTGKSFGKTCISRFKCLRVLDLRDSCLEVLPSSIGRLKHLRYLDLSHNPTIKKLPNSICKLHNLQMLSLVGCRELEELPQDIGNLINLRIFYITTMQKCLPEEGIRRLISLRFLWIDRCDNLESLGEGVQHLTALRTLAIWGGASLKSLPRNMKYLTSLQTLVIASCEMLDLVEWCMEEDIQGLRFNFQSLFIRELQQLETLPQWLEGAANTLQLLNIEGCPNLKALSEWLQNLTSLQKLEIRYCPKLSALPDGMDRLTSLRQLKILWCNPELSRRCKWKTGEDWPKIAHIPKISIDGENIEVSGRSTRDEAGPSWTASVPQLPTVAVVPSPSAAVPSQTQRPSRADDTVILSWDEYECMQQKLARLEEEKGLLPSGYGLGEVD